MKNDLIVFTDGGARGNPGPAAVGYVIKNSLGRILCQQSMFVGQTTNNVAEYRAVIEALKWLIKKTNLNYSQINFFLDSKLVVNQLNGFYKVKETKMRNLIIEVRQLERELGGNVFYHLIPRQKNKLADSLVNQTLNRKFSKRLR
jgi:ribonuclease HI